MQGCLLISTSTYLAVKLFSDPGFARNQKLSQEHGGGGDLKGELFPLLGSITSIICFAITGVFGSW